MCGQENKKMSVQSTVEELTENCMHIRKCIEDISDQVEKEKIILKHIKTFADGEARITDFQKGLEWFNVSEELSMKKNLAGKIVILDFFTYCCINCMHILPDLESLEKKYSIEDGLVVIGVHSAKFSNEKDSKKILSAVQRYNITHPVVNDAKLSTWRDLGIVCWPSLVMLGPAGQPLAVFVGEGHREELFLYTKMALAYFKSLKLISEHSLPLKPAQHLLPPSRSTLLFPGKIQTFQFDNEEKLIVSDTGNNRILMMDTWGKVEHVIGGYNRGFKDGSFKEARFNAPQGICFLDETIFVADNENHAIRKIDLINKSVTTVAGTGSQGHDYKGGKRGKDQELSSPWDVAIYIDRSGTPVLLIAVAGTHQIWALFLEDTEWWKNQKYKVGTCVAIVGSGREENRNNSYPHVAGLAQPSGLAVWQEQRSVFFADSESSSIRRVYLEDGRVSAVCGADKNPSNLHNFGDIDGIQYGAKLQHPLGIAWNNFEQAIYVADTYNHKIKKVDVSGNCKTLYGAGKPTDMFTFDEPSGLAVNPVRNIIYVADTNNHCIKAVNLETNEISNVPIELPKESTEKGSMVYEFETVVSADGGVLRISFDLFFQESLKLNPEAPQKWSLALPAETWVPAAAAGSLSEPISVETPRGEGVDKLCVIIDAVACKSAECVPKKLSVVFNVRREPDGPARVAENKRLVVT